MTLNSNSNDRRLPSTDAERTGLPNPVQEGTCPVLFAAVPPPAGHRLRAALGIWKECRCHSGFAALSSGCLWHVLDIMRAVEILMELCVHWKEWAATRSSVCLVVISPAAQ